MFKLLIMFLLTFFSIIMIFLMNPLSMGLMILIQTLLTCMMSGMLLDSYWFSYILFLTFLGGLLVLFIYVSSVAYNEMFSLSMNNMIMMSILFLFMFMLLMYMNKYNLNWMNFLINYEMNNFLENYLFFNNENKFNLSKLYNNQTYILNIMLVIYLFITLIATVKITNIFFGPLRISK